jgi:hypothetical protein
VTFYQLDVADERFFLGLTSGPMLVHEFTFGPLGNMELFTGTIEVGQNECLEPENKCVALKVINHLFQSPYLQAHHEHMRLEQMQVWRSARITELRLALIRSTAEVLK